MRVVFVNMPFGSVRPAMGVSLLLGHLERMGVEGHVEYFNLLFAERAGGQLSWYISELAPSQLLAGEHVFAGQVFDRLAGMGADEAFEQMVQERFGSLVTRRSLDRIRTARTHAAPFLDDCMERLDWSAVDLVGFTTTFTQTTASLALAKRLKQRHPHLKIAFGGANCEETMGLQMHRSFPFIDFVSTGEADLSFPRLIESLRDGGEGSEIAGMIWRSGGESTYTRLVPDRLQDLDALPYPNFDDFFREHRRVRPAERRPAALMETSRGCWWGEKHHCTFCGANGLSLAYRSKSPERALDEVESVVQRYGTRTIQMVDNILDMSYLRSFLPALIARDLQVDLFYETKANLTRDQIALMRSAGITSVQPGIESLSSHVLKLMDKGITGVQNIQTLKWFKEYGIVAHWNILYGFAGEEVDDYRLQTELCPLLQHLEPPQSVFAIRLERFSPNFRFPEKYGFGNVAPDRSYAHVFDLDHQAVNELAYYFEHDYLDGRDPELYTRGIREAVDRWRVGSSRGAALTLTDTADGVIIDDSRYEQPAQLVLDGSEAALYRWCDTARPWTALVEHMASMGCTESWVRRTVDHLLEHRVLLELDGRLLALAVLERSPEERGALAAEQPRLLRIV